MGTLLKGYINELQTSLSQTKIILMNYKHHYHKQKKINFYRDTPGRHSFYHYGIKKSKTTLIDLEDTVCSVYLAQINFYAWLTNRNLYSYILEEIINEEKSIYNQNPQQQKTECLYALVMSRTCLRVNRHSIFG